MPFHSIPDILINGKNSCYGGKIYNVDISIGLVNEPSSISISFVNESGDFLDPELSVTKPYKIQIPNVLNEDYYAVRSEYKKSSNGRILQVKFLDGSIILDRLFIGLFRKMGIQNAPGLILVGKELHPCDINGNGVFDAQDAAELRLQSDDPCELKCPGDIQERENVIEACAEKELNDIFDVQYNFEDLLNAIQNKNNTNIAQPNRNIPFYRAGDESGTASVISVPLPNNQLTSSFSIQNTSIKVINAPQVFNRQYLNGYYGSLREVLANWCSDFGWSFYWENGGLNFIDTKERPKINFTEYSNLQEKNVVKSIEDTVARGIVTYYAEPAIRPSSSCGESKPYMLRCFNLRDLFGINYKPAWNAVAINDKNNRQISTDNILTIDLEQPTTDNTDNQNAYLDQVYPDGVVIREFEKMCTLAYYSDALRRLYIMWEYYGINNAAAALTIKNKWLDRMGQRKIVNVFSKDTNDDSSNFYNNIKNGIVMGSSGPLLSKETIERMDKWDGYFIVTLRNPAQKVDEELADRQFEIEQRLAIDFFGKHWFKNLASPYLGGNPQIAPQGEYFAALSTNVSDIPFAQFNHTYKSNISKMVNGFSATVQSQNYKQFGVKKLLSGGLGNTTNSQLNKKNLRSIVYTQRDTQDRWFPIKDSPTSLNAFIKAMEPFTPERIDLSDLPIETKRALATNGSNGFADGVNETNLNLLELYVVYPGQFNIETKFAEHVNEEPRQKDEGLSDSQQVTYGLMTKQTVVYEFKAALNKDQSPAPTSEIETRGNFALVQIYLPVGSSVLHDIDIEEKNKIKFSKVWIDDGFASSGGNLIDFSVPGYKILVTETSDARGFIPKFESALVTPPPSLEARNVEYQVENINKGDAIRLLNRLTTSCEMPADQILALHQLYSQNLNFSSIQPFVSREYTVMGIEIPSKVNIKNGLEGVSIRVGADGVFTTIRIGDSLFTPPSNTFLLKQIQLAFPAAFRNARSNPI